MFHLVHQDIFPIGRIFRDLRGDKDMRFPHAHKTIIPLNHVHLDSLIHLPNLLFYDIAKCADIDQQKIGST